MATGSFWGRRFRGRMAGAITAPAVRMIRIVVHSSRRKQRQGKDVDLTLVPAVYGGAWDVWARAFFAASDLGLLPRSHEAVFAAIHRDGRLPRNPSAQKLGTFFSSYGVDGDRFRAAMADPKVDARMDRARKFAIASGAEGTPTLVVNGRYLVMNENLGSWTNVREVIKFLVAQERRRLGLPTPPAPAAR